MSWQTRRKEDEEEGERWRHSSWREAKNNSLLAVVMVVEEAGWFGRRKAKAKAKAKASKAES